MRPDELSAVIIALRTSRGWTQTQLAERAGLSRNCIALIENKSPKANSTLSTLAAIFGAFNLDVSIRFVPKDKQK